MRHLKINKYVSHILLVVWCGVIFYLSHQESTVSGNNSLDVLRYLLFWVDSASLVSLNGIFREFMHFGMFCILGILCYNSFRFNFKYIILASLVFCGLYALSDEIHQLFINGRAFEIVDLVLDFVGSLVGIFILWGFNKLRK